MSKKQEIEIQWHSKVAGAIADAIGEAIQEQGSRSFIQAVAGDREDGVSVEYDVSNHHEILAAAFDALCEHQPDEIDDPASVEVIGIDIAVDEESTITILTDFE